ncbi:hypothetical protein ACOTC8_10110 [Achromobacter xylosoxidans]|jgi:hypothetical protein|uniref:hypothetical protein n=1 Tax=Achromobacter TaxID=222 RepID=UPI0006AC2535|nr:MULTISPECIES: hypothetical protein [Achromobacter]AXA78102.1 hypothetical protein CE206_17380 [Achromobacter xylosoxidans]KOQ17741.1 hypothetical protein ABW34_29365 [Achromobacter xylosoxidans]KOQ18955.1 hypothetical protein ABW36_29105 [Achromobacter xylosoxidans]KOQ20562.1 hypothetical protein ABW35_23625 [Achromobacter xylosoxidans]KOQ37123.1 hypothetical protein ABW39_29175 [Achromobacter xylosoxidans]
MSEAKDCFIIMPIADADGYPQGHFKHVYDNIVAPSCVNAGYRAVRADEIKATNLIHLDILKRLIEAPIAICDLSSRNPNVLFELGIRQAFDRPVVLIQESGTPKIFDIAPLRYLEYSKDMKYHDVLRSQGELKDAIEATVAADADTGNVNSIVKLLALNQPAKIPELKGGKGELALSVLQAEIQELRKLMEYSLHDRGRVSRRGSITAIEFERISTSLEKIQSAKRVPMPERVEQLHMLMRETEELLVRCEEKSDHMHFRHLMERIHRAIQEIA